MYLNVEQVTLKTWVLFNGVKIKNSRKEQVNKTLLY